MALEAQAEIEIAKPVDEVFALATSCAGFPRFLLRMGPIPAVASAELVGAAEPKAGGRRRLVLGDGSTMDEEILAYERPSHHRYRWASPPAPPFSWLVRGATGDWVFSPLGSGTRVRWTYSFEPASSLAALFARPVVAIFQRWMQRGLVRLRELLVS
jgi:uncharacterized protein YndB with AHSA1/START domain